MRYPVCFMATNTSIPLHILGVILADISTGIFNHDIDAAVLECFLLSGVSIHLVEYESPGKGKIVQSDMSDTP